MDNLIHGFQIISETPLEELHAEGIFTRHQRTGLEVYHIRNDDTENLFAFAFMTPPQDSSGVAHILEHSVLCGSKRYPIRDPFLALEKQSVKTFLNAMTFPDKTVYPASSIVETDYFNLMSVYGDAVFFPLLERKTFEQEGWRLERAENGTIRYSGVVLNEMRGAYADFDSAVDRQSRYSLLQDTLYAQDSGGYPPAIVDLSYEAFLAFHRRYYHPVNCKVFLYGNIPTEKQLRFLDERFLCNFQAAERPPLIPAMQPYSAPRLFSTEAPAGEGKNPHKISMTMNWLLPESADIDRFMDLIFLEETLLGHDGSPLQRRLLECRFADDVYPYNGGQADLKNMCFTIGLADLARGMEQAFETFILSSLKDIIHDGIDTPTVETALNSIDFSNREIIRSGGPFSLILMRRALRGWLHGATPDASLRYGPAFERLKERIAATPHYTEQLIRTLLLENPHRTLVSVRPDPQFCKRIDAELTEKAQKAVERLTTEQQAAMPHLRQETVPETEPDVHTLIPHLSKKDLPAVEEPIPEYGACFGQVPVIFHEQPTNGITYLNLAVPADSLSPEEYRCLTVYTAALSSMGTQSRDWASVAADFAHLTGGFAASAFAAGAQNQSDPDSRFSGVLHMEDIVNRDWVFIRIKMLPEYITSAIEYLFSYLQTVSFYNTNRLIDILIQLKNDMDCAPADSGHSLAALHAGSAHSPLKQAENLWFGVPQLRFLRAWYKRIETDAAAAEMLAARLDGIHRKLLKAGMLIKVCGGASDMETVKQALSPHLRRFSYPNRPQTSTGFRSSRVEMPEALTGFPSDIQVGFSALTLPFAFQENRGAGVVYAQWMETGMLWNAIRVAAGAYGVSAYPDPAPSLFSFTTYRDPAPLASIRSIRDSISASRKTPLTDSELEALTIGSYSAAIQPRTPAQKSAAAFARLLNGITDQMRKRTIEEILCCTQSDIRRFAEQLTEALPFGTAAAVGSDAMLHDYRRHDQAPVILPPI